MYSVDINLLKDRPGFAREEVDRNPTYTGPVDRTPLWLGGLVGMGAIGLVLLGGAGLAFRNGQLETENANLDNKLQEVAPKLQQLDQIKAQEQQVASETQSLATIFNQIKPWSAMLQDVRGRVPAGLQLDKIEQAAAAAAPASPAGAPQPNATPPAGAPPAPGSTPAPGTPAPGSPAPAPVLGPGLTITGKARSFADVNDFVLSLQQSPFLVGTETKLIKSERAGGGNTPGNASGDLVTYQIRTALSTVPASELLQELRLKGATGLTSRIDFLKQKGVIQK
jgi:type IV pilus assembly protein PilN